MATVVGAARVLALGLFLLLFFFLTLPFYLLLKVRPDAIRAKKALAHLVHVACHLCCRLFLLKPQSAAASALAQRPPGLFVCNHLSYVDVLVLGLLRPLCFVTSQEVRQTPFLGDVCLAAGCLFVERRSRRNLSREVAEMAQALRQGISVLIFPEATSTNGDQVLRFRRPLFQAALDANVNVYPVAISYLRLEGAPVTRENRDQLFWYGDMAFAPHFWAFCRTGKKEVRVAAGPPLRPADFADLKDLAAKAQQEVTKLYHPPGPGGPRP